MAKTCNLLVIEDNDINRLLLEKMLRDLGHNVLSAAGGAEGVAQIKEREFDLIITDISMPEVDGMEVLRRVRTDQLAKGVDIVALTAHAAAEDHARILEAGFAEVLTKPINRQALAELIARRTRGSQTPAVAAPKREGDSDIAQFFKAVGPEKAQHFLSEFRDDVNHLSELLCQSSQLTEDHRQEAHRLRLCRCPWASGIAQLYARD